MLICYTKRTGAAVPNLVSQDQDTTAEVVSLNFIGKYEEDILHLINSNCLHL